MTLAQCRLGNWLLYSTEFWRKLRPFQLHDKSAVLLAYFRQLKRTICFWLGEGKGYFDPPIQQGYARELSGLLGERREGYGVRVPYLFHARQPI